MNVEDRMFNFHFFADFTFEPWDYMNPITKGIGGSETSQIEMSSRLATRYHNVVSYAPVPWAGENGDKERIHRGVTWRNYEDCTFKDDGIWVIYRCPRVLDNFKLPQDRPKQQVWFIAQDVFYGEPGNEINEERASKIDKYICLCHDHANYVSLKHPYLENKIHISSNGINVDLINDISKANLPRNPHRLIYSSSPDRGLEQLIPIFKKAKEFVPDLELHVFYGFDNIDKVIEKMPWVARIKDSIMSGINSVDGIKWHGRIGQIELLCEWAQSGIWCYPINFTETSCISCMEAQAMGVIPIVSPVWALRENVQHGIFVEGNVEDKLTLARFVGEIVRVCQSETLRDKIMHENGDMVEEAKFRFNWERYVDQWESWLLYPDVNFNVFMFSQFAFQHRFAHGSILNVGCDIDSSDFKGLRGATNFDVKQNEKNTVDVIGDFRGNVSTLQGKFDTVILGDIIEHMTREDALLMIKNAITCLKPLDDSYIIITCPQDNRSRELQNPTMKGDEIYKGGISRFHRFVSVEELLEIVEESGLKVELGQDIDCTHFHSTGLVCTKLEV